MWIRYGKLTIVGKGKGDDNTPGVMRAAAQYGVRDQILDCLTFDVTQHPWRRGGWLDAIVTDPPCESINARGLPCFSPGLSLRCEASKLTRRRRPSRCEAIRQERSSTTSCGGALQATRRSMVTRVRLSGLMPLTPTWLQMPSADIAESKPTYRPASHTSSST